MNTVSPQSAIRWTPCDRSLVADDGETLLRVIRQVREPLAILALEDGRRTIASGGISREMEAGRGYEVVGLLPAIYPEWLGDRSFTEEHGCRFAYVVGEMARGIATTDMVIAAAQAGFMGFFGSAGLPVPEVAAALDRIQGALGTEALNWGANLIHSPQETEVERAIVDLFLDRRVRRVSASAYMRMSPEIVRYMARGLHRDANGRIRRMNRIFAKVSRAEVAVQFMSPPPGAMLDKLMADGRLTPEEAELARDIPVAEDITAEADSGGHTDNRTLTVLLPELMALRDRLCLQFGYGDRIRVGAAGGLGSPAGVAAAFAAGAAYVLTGSVNQAAIESGLSPEGRRMLTEAEPHDVAMAPAADMFELGVNVQVLKRGTLFATRGRRLYELYRSCASIEEIPAEVRAQLEKEYFRASLDDVWRDTCGYFEKRDPAEIEKAAKDPKRKMALIFRSYLFRGAQWAREGVADRRSDYQIWCGPAMGAFNAWARESFLEPAENRSVVQIGLNLMEGAAVITRAQQVRTSGVDVPFTAFQFPPRPLG
jgi:PfaD family protein